MNPRILLLFVLMLEAVQSQLPTGGIVRPKTREPPKPTEPPKPIKPPNEGEFKYRHDSIYHVKIIYGSFTNLGGLIPHGFTAITNFLFS